MFLNYNAVSLTTEDVKKSHVSLSVCGDRIIKLEHERLRLRCTNQRTLTFLAPLINLYLHKSEVLTLFLRGLRRLVAVISGCGVNHVEQTQDGRQRCASHDQCELCFYVRASYELQSRQKFIFSHDFVFGRIWSYCLAEEHVVIHELISSLLNIFLS